MYNAPDNDTMNEKAKGQPSKIQVEKLALAYDEATIIEDLNASIPAGKITSIVGPNGCGKSTLLRALARLMKPRGGAVYLDGAAIFELPTGEVARRLGILPQDPKAPKGLNPANSQHLGATRTSAGSGSGPEMTSKPSNEL